VFVNSANQVAGYANVKRAFSSASQNINIISFHNFVRTKRPMDPRLKIAGVTGGGVEARIPCLFKRAGYVPTKGTGA